VSVEPQLVARTILFYVGLPNLYLNLHCFELNVGVLFSNVLIFFSISLGNTIAITTFQNVVTR
jgi:hypothetical protein